jgi:hypothetical protein
MIMIWLLAAKTRSHKEKMMIRSSGLVRVLIVFFEPFPRAVVQSISRLSAQPAFPLLLTFCSSAE